MNTLDRIADISTQQGETLRVEIHTGEYIALGTAVTRHQRLMDVLENLTSSYLRLENARLQFLDRGNAPQTVDSLLVSRDHIRIAIPYEEENAPEARKTHPRYIPKYPVAASLYMDSMAIEGYLHIREGEDAFLATQNLAEPFIAITEAAVRYLDQGRSLPFRCPVVIVNRRFVNLIALRPQPTDDVH
ncbi:MAG: hypothetical protein QHH80_04245 [Anaerolineae bacterium]|nr:hypothetical protein [Anaerolineae bacterium]